MGIDHAFHRGGLFSRSYGPYDNVSIREWTFTLDYEYGVKEILAYAKRIGLPCRDVLHQALKNIGSDIQYFSGINELVAEETDLEGIKELFEESSEHKESSFETDDLISAGLIVQLKELQARHIYVDPFYVHYIPLHFIIADSYALTFKLHRSVMTALFTTVIFMVRAPLVDILTFVRPRLVFDRGRFGTNLLQPGGTDMNPDSTIDPSAPVPYVDPLIIKDGPVTRLHKCQLEYEEFPRDEELQSLSFFPNKRQLKVKGFG